MECDCQVCQALAGLTMADATIQVADQLPLEVRLILAAQERVRLLHPRPDDEALVQEAARRCRAGRFHPLPRH